MLFKKLQLSNYKAFDDVTFSLTSKKNTPKQIAIIYGANGSGKSTILEAFATLNDLLKTKDITNTLDSIRDKISNSTNLNKDEIGELSRFLSRNATSISEIYAKIKGTAPDKPTTIFLEFEENGYNGSYEISLQDGLIIYEELKYLITKNKGCFFRIEKGKTYINENVFLDRNVRKSLRDLLNQSWGIHSFFSLIKNEIQNYNEDYKKKALIENYLRLVKNFDMFSYRICNLANAVEYHSKTSSYILSHISNGYIDRTTKKELKKTERFLSQILKPFIDDFVKAEYYTDERSYKLYLIKRINNKEIPIDYISESSGSKELIRILPFIIKAMSGEIVVLDEYANHMHDVLSLEFLNLIIPLIKGQLIISTHSTVLLNLLNDEYSDSFYFINVNQSKRGIKCIDEIEPRLRKEYNYQKKYLFDSLYSHYRNTSEKSLKELDVSNWKTIKNEP